ncbi:MAG: hypothetical protein AAF533_05790 [Acidobacteriota bacterium]
MSGVGSRIGGRTPRAQRWFLNWTSMGLLVTGVAYWIMKDFMEPDPESFSILGHPWQPHAQHLHVLIAPLWLVGLGLFLRDHVLGRLRAGYRRHRGSGLTLACLVIPMVASGYLIQVSVDETWRDRNALLHVVSSLVFAVVHLWHWVRGWRSSRRLATAAGRPVERPTEEASTALG